MWARKPSSCSSSFQPRLADDAEELDGAVVQRLEGVAVDAAEEGRGLVVPAPPHVVGEFLQRLQAFRQVRQDGEGTNRSAHRPVSP